MKLDIQAICHKGLVRENNEDALSIGGLLLRDDSTTLTVSTPEDGFFYLLVSDGMGGHDDGEEASRFALDEIKEQLVLHQISPERFEDELREAASYISFKLNSAAAQAIRAGGYRLWDWSTAPRSYEAAVSAINRTGSVTVRFDSSANTASVLQQLMPYMKYCGIPARGIGAGDTPICQTP